MEELCSIIAKIASIRMDANCFLLSENDCNLSRLCNMSTATDKIYFDSFVRPLVLIAQDAGFYYHFQQVSKTMIFEN